MVGRGDVVNRIVKKKKKKKTIEKKKMLPLILVSLILATHAQPSEPIPALVRKPKY
jgi:hypothetical protein